MKIKTLVARHRSVAVFALIAALLFAVSFLQDFTSHAQRITARPKAVDKLIDADTELIMIPLAGAITGRVFQDYNSNGLYDTASGLNSIDTGVANVTVTAFDPAGANAGFTVTDASGNYTLNASGTGPYRVEFTNIPAGFAPSARSRDSVSGAAGTDSGSTVQFVPNAATANVNLALDRPEEYCQNNPSLVVARMVEGGQNGVYAANPTLWDFPYNAGALYTDTTVANYDVPSAHTLSVPASASGTVFSLAYSRLNRRIYAASQFKRHAGFGPGANGTFNDADDAGAIYVINPATSAVTSVFTVPNATTNSHDVLDYASDNGNTGWDAVGKSSLGGMDIASDESRLFVMNLQDRKLYALNPSTGASLGSSAAVSTLTLATPGGSAANCAAGNIRPWAVKYYRDKVYVGVICTAESSQSVNDLFAYIVEADPTTLAFSAAPIFATKLNYSRGFADPGASAAWRPWIATEQAAFAFPQPMLASIAFDGGNIMLGMRDRAGDQEFDNGTDAKRTAGDALKACGSFGAWTLESNGRCGVVPQGTAPQNTNQGPSAGEFYFQDDFCMTPNGANFHDEVTWGSLLFLPGRQQVLATVLDPISRTISSTATFDGGLRWLNNSTGATDRAYRVYNGNGGAGVPDFGKANGLGGTVAMCSPAPIEIGNRVWRDLNSNGVQDPGENGISNVQAHLYQGAAVVGTAVTSSNGEYYFVSSATPDGNVGDNIGQVNGGIAYNTAYQVRFDRSGDFAGMVLTTKNQTSQLGDDTASDSDASMVSNPAGSPSGSFPVISLTTGGVGSNNHTFDAGFKTAAPTAANVSLSGRISLPDGSGIRNVIVTLRGADGKTYTALSSTFGYYSFDRVEAGQNVVVSVAAKRFSFSPSSMLVNLTDNLADLNFVAQ
jgi:hypothetical protein